MVDVITYGGFIILACALVYILWGYIKGLAGSPRELYALYLGKMLEYGAYGSINNAAPLLLRRDCGMTKMRAGVIVGVWSATKTISQVLIGPVCDSIGIKRTLIIGTMLMIWGRAFIPLNTTQWMVIYIGFIPLALGMGMVLPVLSVGIKRFTTTTSAALGFALFYTLMNVGWAFAGWIFDRIRIIFGEYEMVALFGSGKMVSTYQIVFLVACALSVVKLIIYFLFRDGVEMTDDRGIVIHSRSSRPKGLGAIARTIYAAASDVARNFREAFREKSFWAYVFMLGLLVPCRLIFYHFHYTWPTYGIAVFGDGAKVGTMYGVLNPLMIVFLTPLVAVMTKKITSYHLLLWGTVLSVGSSILAIVPAEPFSPLLNTWVSELLLDRWLAVPLEKQIPLYLSLIFFVIVFTLGESIWSPRLMQFAAEIAPPGKEGLYISLSYLPYFGAQFIAGPMSGWVLTRYIPDGATSYPDHYMVWVWIGAFAAITPVGLALFRGVFLRAEARHAAERRAREAA